MADPKFLRGAKPSARHELLNAEPYRPTRSTLLSTPPQFAYVPRQLSMWGNDRYGLCVTTEECFAKACAMPELFVTEADAITWARQHNVLNGATLTQVLDAMTRTGLPVGGKTYTDGGKLGVNYTDQNTLRAAISDPTLAGPVKIALDADALPHSAGNQQGWFAIGGGNFPNTDHCISICGYGPADWLYEQLGVGLPSSLSATLPGYLAFTWNTIGFVDHAWILSTCVEAWARRPTTANLPTPPPPTPSGELGAVRVHPNTGIIEYIGPWTLQSVSK